MSMVERIRLLCKEKKLSLFALEKACNFGNGTINKWDKSSPAIEKVAILANILGTSLEYIYSGAELATIQAHGIELTQDEEELISAYRLLNSCDKKEVLSIIGDKVAQTFTNAPKAGSSTLVTGDGNMETSEDGIVSA